MNDKILKSRFKPTRIVLIFWCLFIGVGAVAGAVGMLSDPSGKAMGMDAMLPYFQVLPFAEKLFQNFIFSGISLLIVNGITNLVAAFFLFKKKKIGIILGGIFGITLMLWIIIQFVIFPANFMSTIYFIFGFCQALTGFMAYVFYTQENFEFDETSYHNIATNNNELVVYFSRMGYGKKLAYEKAEQSGAEILEVRTTEKISGNLGFWWCGRFAMHHLDMPIEKIDVDLAKYEKVTLVTPVWAFSLSAPMRAFCKAAKGKIKRADYVMVHFMNAKFENVAKEMDELLGITREKVSSVSSHFGIRKNTIEY